MSLNEVRDCSGRKNNYSNKKAELFFQRLNLHGLKLETKKILPPVKNCLQIDFLIVKNQSENETGYYTSILASIEKLRMERI